MKAVAVQAAAIVSIMVALGRYEGPVSEIVPLTDTNTPVAVLRGLVVRGSFAVTAMIRDSSPVMPRIFLGEL